MLTDDPRYDFWRGFLAGRERCSRVAFCLRRGFTARISLARFIIEPASRGVCRGTFAALRLGWKTCHGLCFSVEFRRAVCVKRN